MTLRPPADIDLMLQVRDGDEYAFEELYRRYNRRVLNFFFALSGDATAADDMAIETFARIWRLRGRYRATGPFPAYAFAVARNIWLEHRRELRKQWRLGFSQSIDEACDVLEAAERSPSEVAISEEIQQQVWTALAGLPEEQRVVFVLRVLEGMSLPDIATILRCPVNTVRSRKLLALKKLREMLRAVLI